MRILKSVLLLVLLGMLVPLASAAATEKAPSWTLQTPGGETVAFPADAHGHPTVLLFWPSWCPYSRALQPYVQDIWQDYRSVRVNVWTINIKETGDPVQTLRDRGLSFPLLLKGDDLIPAYGITRTPWLVVIDGQDRIVYTRPAKTSSPIEVAKSVRQTLNQLLGSRAVALPTRYPAPYDLHLRKAKPSREQAEAAPASEWVPWASQAMVTVKADELEATQAPLGVIENGKAAIHAARVLWKQAYGAEIAAGQEPVLAYRHDNLWLVSGAAVSGNLGKGATLIIEAGSGQVVRLRPPATVSP